MSPECGGLTVHPQCVCVYLCMYWGGGRGSARDRAGPWDLWLVFGRQEHLPGWPSPGHPPPCLPWFTQMDFDTRGAGASCQLATAPPPGQTGPSPPHGSRQCGHAKKHAGCPRAACRSATLLGQAAPGKHRRPPYPTWPPWWGAPAPQDPATPGFSSPTGEARWEQSPCLWPDLGPCPLTAVLWYYEPS